MKRSGLAAALAVAACSPTPDRTADQVDIANAAQTPLTPRGNVAPVQPVKASSKAEAVAKPRFAPDSAQAAADIVQRYFALIEDGNYPAAWALWGDAGHASGMTAAAFADSFAKYRDYHAEVRAPGRIDAGAGQRYVTVPVAVQGRLKDGDRGFAMEGQVTLHRTADIDGATKAQRQWRISASDLRPGAGAAGQE